MVVLQLKLGPRCLSMLLFKKHISQILHIGEKYEKLVTTSILVLCKKKLEAHSIDKRSIYDFFILLEVSYSISACIWSVGEMKVYLTRLCYNYYMYYWPSAWSKWLYIYWPSLFLVCLWAKTESRSISMQKRTRPYPAILTKQAWSINSLFYRIWGILSCGTQRLIAIRQDRIILSTWVARQP